MHGAVLLHWLASTMNDDRMAPKIDNKIVMQKHITILGVPMDAFLAASATLVDRTTPKTNKEMIKALAKITFDLALAGNKNGTTVSRVSMTIG